VIQVDAVAEPLLPRLRDHLLSLSDLVGNRLLAEHVTTGAERLHGRLEVVAAVLLPAGGDADNVGLELREHLRRVVKRGHAKPCSDGVGAVLPDVAHADELRQRIVDVYARMEVADRTHADDADAEHSSILV
jgi:hypothetical protein